MGNLFAELEAERQRQLKAAAGTTSDEAQNLARKPASSRDMSRDNSRENPHDNSRDLPGREEIQEFSFRLRDELKVKVQAEVPHQWQRELETTAMRLRVRKMELYRFILGEFLGKVKRKSRSQS